MGRIAHLVRLCLEANDSFIMPYVRHPLSANAFANTLLFNRASTSKASRLTFILDFLLKRSIDPAPGSDLSQELLVFRLRFLYGRVGRSRLGTELGRYHIVDSRSSLIRLLWRTASGNVGVRAVTSNMTLLLAVIAGQCRSDRVNVHGNRVSWCSRGRCVRGSIWTWIRSRRKGPIRGASAVS